jgi:hypothetical protein
VPRYENNAWENLERRLQEAKKNPLVKMFQKIAGGINDPTVWQEIFEFAKVSVLTPNNKI